MKMMGIDETIYDLALEEGLSSKTLRLIDENLENLSSNFLTDVLVENANPIYDYVHLIKYLPHIWNNNENSSENLLAYISGLSHRFFYQAREYPLGKNLPDSKINELNDIHDYFHDFKSQCLKDDLTVREISADSIDTFENLLETMKKQPKLPVILNEIFLIISNLFYQFALNKHQRLANIDELSMFLSRCLLLWKLETLTDQELITCFENASNKYHNTINLLKLEKTLALDLQNYQFLQLGINHYLVKLIARVFNNLHS